MSRILLLSPYDATSHRYWREGLFAHFTEHDWECLTLPPRYFAWRIRGNSLSWALGQRQVLGQPWDLLIATGMTDLATLRGLVPNLAQVPTVVYFHENQFAYPPDQEREENRLTAQMLNLYTALAADRVVFNSHYNQQTFMAGVGILLKRMPDAVPPGIQDLLQRKIQVLPVPLWDDCQTRQRTTQPPQEIVWNHRWEYDKAPERFFAALYRLQENAVPFRLHVLGESFRRQPACFAEARERLAEQIVTWGFVPREQYLHILQRATIVVSTARHDFQGVALMEAMACGCIPVVPDRLAYPEYVPAELRYPSADADPDIEVTALVTLLSRVLDDPTVFRAQLPDTTRFNWSYWRFYYQALLADAALML